MECVGAIWMALWTRSSIPFAYSLATGRYGNNFKRVVFKFITEDFYLCIRWKNALESHEWEVIIALGNELVPSGNEQLPAPMAIRRH